MIRQELTGELLQSPSSCRSTDGAGNKALEYNLLAFSKINCLQSSIASRLMEDL